jgi:hypothetical protein
MLTRIQAVCEAGAGEAMAGLDDDEVVVLSTLRRGTGARCLP